MTVTQYIGARYVPIFADPIEWSNTRAYEPLTGVQHNGNSYVSRQSVPIGVDIENTNFWLLWAEPNAQMAELRNFVTRTDDELRDYVSTTDDELRDYVSTTDDELRDYVDGKVDSVAYNSSSRLKGLLPAHCVISHRGFRHYAPENSKAAFIEAAKLGVKCIESDIRFTSDGVPVMMHDATLDRTTTGTGNIADKTFAQCRALTLKDNAANFPNEKIPTLAEYLEICSEYRITPMIELKAGFSSEKLRNTFFGVIDQFGMRYNCIYMTQSVSWLRILRNFDKNIALFWNTDVSITQENIDECLSSDFDGILYNRLNDATALLQEAADAGLYICRFTGALPSNWVETMPQVNGVICDNPLANVTKGEFTKSKAYYRTKICGMFDDGTTYVEMASNNLLQPFWANYGVWFNDIGSETSDKGYMRYDCFATFIGNVSSSDLLKVNKKYEDRFYLINGDTFEAYRLDNLGTQTGFLQLTNPLNGAMTEYIQQNVNLFELHVATYREGVKMFTFDNIMNNLKTISIVPKFKFYAPLANGTYNPDEPTDFVRFKVPLIQTLPVQTLGHTKYKVDSPTHMNDGRYILRTYVYSNGVWSLINDYAWKSFGTTYTFQHNENNTPNAYAIAYVAADGRYKSISTVLTDGIFENTGRGDQASIELIS